MAGACGRTGWGDASLRHRPGGGSVVGTATGLVGAAGGMVGMAALHHALGSGQAGGCAGLCHGGRNPHRRVHCPTASVGGCCAIPDPFWGAFPAFALFRTRRSELRQPLRSGAVLPGRLGASRVDSRKRSSPCFAPTGCNTSLASDASHHQLHWPSPSDRVVSNPGRRMHRRMYVQVVAAVLGHAAQTVMAQHPSKTLQQLRDCLHALSTRMTETINKAKLANTNMQGFRVGTFNPLLPAVAMMIPGRERTYQNGMDAGSNQDGQPPGTDDESADGQVDIARLWLSKPKAVAKAKSKGRSKAKLTPVSSPVREKKSAKQKPPSGALTVQQAVKRGTNSSSSKLRALHSEALHTAV